MNINDAKVEEVQGDRLVAIFERQESLMRKYQVIEDMPAWPMSLHTKESQIWFKDFAWRFVEEIAEAMEAADHEEDSMINGDNDLADVHRAHHDEELADALHFLVENLIIIGITPEMLVGEIPTELKAEMDMLGYIFSSANAAYSTLLDSGLIPTTDEVTMDVIKELGKAMNCLKNKKWKQTQILTDEKKFRNYMVSTFFSFIILLVHSGIDAEGVTNLYFKKSQVNQFRQRSKY